MKLNVQKGRMFKSVQFTGSYIYGCDHNCAYPCYARLMSERYNRSFTPRLVQLDKSEVLDVRDAVVFLNSMGDICCPGVQDQWILDMLEWIGVQDPSNKFLVQTKNPGRLAHPRIFPKLLEVKDRVRLGTTIESTDRSHKYTAAPPYLQRAGYLANFKYKYGFETFLSGEPLLRKLDPREYFGWVSYIKPTVTEFGLLNYRDKSKLNLFRDPGRVDPDPRDYETLRGMYLKAGLDFIEKDSVVKWRQTEAYKARVEVV